MSYSHTQKLQFKTFLLFILAVDLLGLLNWKANPAAVPMHLKNLTKVDGEEIVKFLQDTLDALFSILMQNSDSGTYDQPVFDALVSVQL